jgi:hypothetical protein
MDETLFAETYSKILEGDITPFQALRVLRGKGLEKRDFEDWQAYYCDRLQWTLLLREAKRRPLYVVRPSSQAPWQILRAFYHGDALVCSEVQCELFRDFREWEVVRLDGDGPNEQSPHGLIVGIRDGNSLIVV